ncbi:hypothetical protein JAAARDRAFT_178792 [Jaapia argillacea MUCL 33604]|uniref:Calcium-dependent phosphotriesterase n=1 Tax=Jaapia argillacea MUCL 33604 TaxID=933084 RepID=A0A067PTM2_9AGAM|nr:hypothetical protein JAAARDRAFT_178792 [Jaapia argillacea MUCL 33604]
MARLITYLLAILAIIVYRSGSIARKFIFQKPDLPLAYYSRGNFNNQCKVFKEDSPIGALKSCEDAVFWDHRDGEGKLQDRAVLITCDPGRHEWNTVMGPLKNPVPAGTLWVYSGKQDAKPQVVTFAGYPSDHDFHPLGLEIYPSYAGNFSNLFIINHGRGRSTIEQFIMSPSDLTTAQWVRTLSSPYFVAPNSLALTSPTSFYVSNDHLMTRRLPSILGATLPLVESVLGLPLGWVSHISFTEPDPNSDSTASPIPLHHTFSSLGIPFANGVAVSHGGTHVAVASTTLALVDFYNRDPATNKITYTNSVPVPFLPDNIMFDDFNSLIVAGHPNFPALTAVARNDTDAKAPSWVVSLNPRRQIGEKASKIPMEYDTKAPVSSMTKATAVASHVVETLFQSNGTGFQTSSSGLRDERTGVLYVVGLYEEGLLVCQP